MKKKSKVCFDDLMCKTCGHTGNVHTIAYCLVCVENFEIPAYKVCQKFHPDNLKWLEREYDRQQLKKYEQQLPL